jgi:hypothetical protein
VLHGNFRLPCANLLKAEQLEENPADQGAVAYNGCGNPNCALGAGSSPLGIPGRIDAILLANPKIYHSADGKPLTSTNQGGNVLNITVPH